MKGEELKVEFGQGQRGLTLVVLTGHQALVPDKLLNQ